MKNLRLKLAQWIAPKGYVLARTGGKMVFSSKEYKEFKSLPILQDQFMTDEQAEDEDNRIEFGYETFRKPAYYKAVSIEAVSTNPSDLWRETRKQLVEDKQDDK